MHAFPPQLSCGRNLLAKFVVIAFAAAITDTAAMAQTPARTTTLEDCVVSLQDQTIVPAQQAGVLVSLAVREGAMVVAGQPLGQLDSSQQLLKHKLAEIERQAAEKKAAEDIDVRFSRASAAVSETEYQQSLAANERVKNTIPQPEVRRLKLAAHKTVLQIEKADSDRHAAGLALASREAEAKLTASEVARCQIDSPIQGEIVELLRKPGEWVNPGDGIARVVRLDILRVEGFLSTAQHDPLSVEGSAVNVTITLAGGRTEAFPGRIVFVSPLVQAGDQYRVWAEVENRQLGGRWLMQPGMKAQMKVELK